MNTPDRDRALDQLLRQAAVHSELSHGDDCLDAETLAAWMDGGLDRAAARSAEAHMASCARCQTLVATLSRTMSADLPESLPSGTADVPWWRVNMRWLVPITAGVTAGLLWTVIPDQQRAASIEEQQFAPASEIAVPAPPAPVGTPERDRIDQPALQAASPEQARPEPPIEARRSDQAVTADAPSVRSEASAVPEPPADEKLSASRSQPPAAPAPAPASAPPAPAAAREAAKGGAGITVFRALVPLAIPTPDAATRWRVTGAAVERTTDGGQTWVGVETGDAAWIRAGSAPSADVCWLVGDGGTVLLTTDARTWRRTTAPAAADLVGVTATDHLNAVVRTADGQAFRTTDGGATWTVSSP